MDERLKQANLVRNKDLNIVSQCTNKSKGNVFDLSYFLDKTFFGDDGLQYYLIFQPLIAYLKTTKNGYQLQSFRNGNLKYCRTKL